MQSPSASLPRIAFAAWSGSGKTTLLQGVIPALRARGLRPAMIKHAHHAFDVDKPGKDSFELRHAGADQMLVASSRRYALMVETPETDDGRVPDLDMLCSRLDPQRADLILVEGFKQSDLPKIEVHRPGLSKPPLYHEIDGVIAVATDAHTLNFDGPLLPVNDPDAVARFIIDYLNIDTPEAPDG
ncbi:MAG: molybdopterin-guanine dinucleotide biosynthesis protein B [Thioalkalivibrio sp.]|jgi:molybdopterin-guanine dinucleotide biosynthesis protein B|nr:molybdopterin-guanine dinucleotide biosynthesis protein B [Thioalkalivibrio sp.]